VQTEAEFQKSRADALQLERDALTKQVADLREKLAKALSDLDEIKSTLEHLVPRSETCI
jgi:hypothetical protein